MSAIMEAQLRHCRARGDNPVARSLARRHGNGRHRPNTARHVMKLPLKTDSYGLNWIGAILAALVTQRKPFDHQQAAALAAAAESELVTAGKRHCQKYCVLKRDLR